MSAKSLLNTGMLYTDRRDFYINPYKVAELYGSAAPFTSIMLAKGTSKTNDPDFKMFEHRSGFLNRWWSVNDGTITTNYDTFVPGDTAIVAAIDGISGFGGATAAIDSMVGYVVEVWDSAKTTFKGVSIVKSVSSGAMTLTSMGNYMSATNAHAALADNDVMIVITNAFGEGTEAPEADSDELEVIYNSCQIFKKSVEITGTLYQASLRGYSNELARLRAEKAKDFDYEIEKAFLFNQRAKGTGMTSLAGTNYSSVDSHADTVLVDANGKKIRTTMGLLPAIYKYGATSGDYQNIFTINKNSYNYQQLLTDGAKVFQYNPATGRKIGLCGQGVLNYWSALASDSGFAKKSGFNITLSKAETSSLGFIVKTLEIPGGIIDLVYAPQMRGQYFNTMLLIDEANIDIKQYRPMKYMTNIKKENAYDGVKDMFMYDAGLAISLIESHSVWKVV